MKRLLALAVVLLLSIESFGAVVGDNDGAAFITKAEFESLKNDFQTQINRYNTSLDSKIDGAIATYISGITIAKKTRETNLLNKLSNNYYFDKNYKKPPTKIGTYGRFWGRFSGINLRKDASGMNYVEITDGTVERNSAGWIYVGSSSNKSTFFVFRDDNAYTGKIEYIMLLESVPYTMMNIGASHTATATVENITAIQSATSDVICNKGSLTDWGAWSTSINNIDVFVLSSGSRRAMQNCVGVYTLGNTDTTLTSSTWDYFSLPPGTVVSTDKIHAFNIKNINKIGYAQGADPNVYTSPSASIYRWDLQSRQPWYEAHNLDGTKVVGAVTNSQSHYLGTYLYDHAYDWTYNTFDINLTEISTTVESFSTYGDGLPIFTSSQNGTVKFTLNTGALYGTETTPNFEIRAQKFNNTAMNSSPFATLTDATTKKITAKGTAVSGKYNNYEIEFDVKKDTTYWIVAKPDVDDKVYLKIVGDIVSTED